LASFGLGFFQSKTHDLTGGNRPLNRRLLDYSCAIVLSMTVAGLVAYFPAIGAKDKQFFRQAEINDQLSVKAEQLGVKLHRMAHTNFDNPAASIQRALLLKQLHRHSEAYALFESICDQSLDYPVADFHYLNYLMWLGRYDRAAELIQRIKSRNPRLLSRIAVNFRGIARAAYQMFVEKTPYAPRPHPVRGQQEPRRRTDASGPSGIGSNPEFRFGQRNAAP
jgi:tetratricopeptide (TPR) repeat protein